MTDKSCEGKIYHSLLNWAREEANWRLEVGRVLQTVIQKQQSHTAAEAHKLKVNMFVQNHRVAVL